MSRIAIALTCLLLTAHGFRDTLGDAQPTADTPRRMSFHNRLLLNRAVLAGLRSMEVLLLLKKPPTDGNGEATAAVTETIARLGGRVRKTEGAVGYLRIELAPERLIELVASRTIEAYQISSLSRGSWYRDGPPLANAQMFRDYEVTPVAATEPANNYAHLPALTPAEARAPGFTADNDIGVGEWTRDHPTFDGRGVTIAILESATPSFADPVFRTAKMLDGRDVPKIAGILNAIDPDHPDETRVRLTSRLNAPKSWARIGTRTHVMPRPGTYWTGTLNVPAGANVVHQFAVIEDDVNGEIWIDSNGDASFQDEKPLADVNERFDPRVLKLTFPRKVDVSFVMSRASDGHVVHIYLGASSHQSMTASAAAGNQSDESLASGVARNARLLFVRTHGSMYGLGNLMEAFIAAAKRPDVDVVGASLGLSMVPDTDGDLLGLLFRRLTATYRKPIVTGAGNFGLMLAHVHGHGGALSAGGTLGPETYAALHGGRPLSGMIVHHTSAAGPALDGAIKPDFLAPMERIAANPRWDAMLQAAPQNAPTRRVPPGYEVSCCTSASSPYAAGVVALLISAARQSNVTYSVESLSRALRVTARPIAGFQAHQQGNGALDINAAWRELARPFDPPPITASAAIVHPLAQYAARGPHGQGILEFEGWTAGMKGMREIWLRRESGPREPVTYTLRWSADDGTFKTAPSVTLSLNHESALPVTIDTKSPGAHSGLLTLHDPVTNAVAFRTQATIVAAEQVDRATGFVTVNGTVGLMRENAHYFQIPSGVNALMFELEVTRGVVLPGVLQSHGLIGNYYMPVHPMLIFTIGKGTYRLLMPNPEPGTWTFHVSNDSASRPPHLDYGPRDDDDAQYSLTLRVMNSSIEVSSLPMSGMAVNVRNLGVTIAEPVIEAWPGILKSHRAAFRDNGLSNLVEIDVPADAASLSLQLRSDAKDVNTELFLYDCTTGECFSYDIGFPAAVSQTLLVRKPTPGRWVAAVNAAPFPAAAGSFVLDEVITTGTPIRRASSESRAPNARWTEVFDTLPTFLEAEGRTPVVFFELLDAAAERDEVERPWSSHPRFIKLRDRPVAIGTAIYRR